MKFHLLNWHQTQIKLLKILLKVKKITKIIFINEKKGKFFKQLIDYNDNMMKEIDILKKKNDLLISQNKEKEKILLEKEQQKFNLLVESGINKEEILKSRNDGSYQN